MMDSANNDEIGGQSKEKGHKRKKDCDKKPDSRAKDFDLTWTQTASDLTLTLQLKSKLDKPDKLDVRFEESHVSVGFPDGTMWLCRLFSEVKKDKSRVIVKGPNVELKMVKKVSQSWPTYQDLDKKSTVGISSENPITATSLAGDGDGDTLDREVDDRDDEKMEKDEEPIYYVDHIKHDFFERDDNFVLHIYVRGIGKDAVKVYFEKDMFLVKFNTRDDKFLQLHQNTSEDTVFCWKVNVNKEIKPDVSRYKVTTTYIELTLKKVSTERWHFLEVPRRKEVEAPKSDTWISTKKTTSTTAITTTTTTTKPVFDEMSNINASKNLSGSKISRGSDKNEKTPSAVNTDNIQKPTCKVQPLNKCDGQQVVVAGFTGLDNLGNTCFMNSVLQALANTREFRDFFLDARFQLEINQDNPLGTGGNLAVAFAILLKNMWSGKKYSVPPGKLKDIVSRKASQFTGFAQHDAQEFMAFLLDGLHEDLNRVKKKPYTTSVDSDGRADETVANESWEIYKKRNDSVIVDLFQGQYKSKLVCPVCSKVSITFDPFLYLSVPLPKKCRLLPVTFMWREPYKRPVRFMVRLPKDSHVEQLKGDLSKKTGVKAKDMRVFEAYRGKIHKFFPRGSSLSSIQMNDNIIVSEVLSEDVAGEGVYEVPVVQRTLMPHLAPLRCSQCRKPATTGFKLKRCSKCFKVGYCDQACQRSHWQMHKSICNVLPEPVGVPFIISIPESRATYSRLCNIMEAYARYSVDVFQPPIGPASKLSSHSSTSNLSSSSSQSSGSLNSLDSQSSSASTHTLTANGEQNLDDVVSPEDSYKQVSASTTALAGSMMSLESEQNSTTVAVSESSSNDDSTEGQSSDVGKNITIGKSDGNISDNKNNGRGDIPTNPVMGIQTEESERAMPLFYIKPVSPEGVGLKGPDGERLEDKGEVTLDLSGSRCFLSIDWRNSDKLASYVLLQSKELDAEDDDSMQCAISEDHNNINLDQCLDVFTEPEVLSPDEAWYCPQCKKHREATKQMSIWRLPSLLIIQLKRFSFRNFIFRDKIDKMVEFPTRGLDLSKFILGQTEKQPVYDLYAVINHHGGILGGHYTAYARCTDTVDPLKNEVDWRLCDDSRVSSISCEKNVVTRAAYLLFYRQRTYKPLLSSPMSQQPSEKTMASDPSPVASNTTVKNKDTNVKREDTTMKYEDTAMKKDTTRKNEDTNGENEDTIGENADIVQVVDEIKNNSDMDLNNSFEDDKSKGNNSDNRSVYKDLGYTDMDAVD